MNLQRDELDLFLALRKLRPALIEAVELNWCQAVEQACKLYVRAPNDTTLANLHRACAKREHWLERASVYEHDAGMEREAADRLVDDEMNSWEAE